MLYITLTDDNSYRSQHEEGRLLLLKGVQQEYGLTLTQENISVDRFGKPFFREYPGIHFSISHCDGLAGCLISKSECGLDCERIRPARYKVARRVFSPEEFRLFEKLHGDTQDIFFTSLWTLKEAYSKLCGRGLAVIKEISFHGDKNGRIISCCPRLEFRQYRLGEHIISLCGDDLPEVEYEELSPFLFRAEE